MRDTRETFPLKGKKIPVLPDLEIAEQMEATQDTETLKETDLGMGGGIGERTIGTEMGTGITEGKERNTMTEIILDRVQIGGIATTIAQEVEMGGDEILE